MILSETDRRVPIFSNPSRLKIGVFSSNFQRGGTATFAEGSIAKLDWRQQVKIAQLSEDAGLDALIPAARWRGYPGPSRWAHETYDVFAWAAGLAAVTTKIMLFSTVHVPLFHPVQVAKLTSTIDHISDGRLALNIVAGWNVEEFDMFDCSQREHDERYAHAGEWADFVKRLWMEHEEFDFNGTFFQSRKAFSEPKPIQQPRLPIMSAGSSPAGRAFAAKHADICFVAGRSNEELRESAENIRQLARAQGRSVQIWTTIYILCAETEAEANREFEYVVYEKGDFAAVEASLAMLLKGDHRSTKIEITPEQKAFRLFGGSRKPIVGSPEQVVAALEEISDAGIDGVACIWWNYERGIEIYRDLIRPLAIDAGIRA